MFGTMIEVPRGALTADEIARDAAFFSFGTNDLTQMTFGFSRDDAEGGFLLKYVEDKILPFNPFQTLDDAVAGLMRTAVEKGRATRPDLELGICGEHGGDPESIAKCERIGLDYVSCSPFRVPVARLAAAQAVLTAPRARQVGGWPRWRRSPMLLAAPGAREAMTAPRRRRWDPDERRIGVGDATSHLATLDALRGVAAEPGWVAEEPEAHLLPHIREAVQVAGSPLAMDASTTDPDGTFVVDVHWVGAPDADARAVRVASLALIATITESTTAIRERRGPGLTTYEVVTGSVPGDTAFATHGHTLRLRVAGVTRADP